MTYPLEADSDLDEDAGFLDDNMLANDADFCDEYEDVDFAAVGVDPARATKAKPGSEEKVMMLAARYAAGMPLWHFEDCTDHGPARERQTDA